MKFEVTYMSGAGNLFSVIQFDSYPDNLDLSNIAELLCNTNEFIKFSTEGLIAILPPTSDITDFEVLFYNPDGSSGMMCGNGGRCAVRYALNAGYKANNLKFKMAGNMYQYEIIEKDIKLYFAPPLEFSPNIDIEINDTAAYIGDYINVGTLHYVINYDDFQEEIGSTFREFKINDIAPAIRNHKEFSPGGVNVNFFQIIDDKIYLRTYEKGVEAETGACGTGAISTALSLMWKSDLKPPMQIIPTAGEPLEVDFEFIGLRLSSIILKGPAEIIGKEVIELPD